MLFSFDATKVSFQKIKIKSISTMMGGVLVYLDEEQSTPTKEVFHRMKIPSSLALLFKKMYKHTQFLKPQEVCLMKYEGKVIGVEKHIINERFEHNREGVLVEWRSYMELNLSTALRRMYNISSEWYFDGSYIYSFQDQVSELGYSGLPLSADGKFRSASVTAFRVAIFNTAGSVNEVSRQCLVYSPTEGVTAISPPIWAGIGNVKRATDLDEGDGLASQFDQINDVMALNLNFALAAGNALSKQYGYKSIEPLQLPRLMIQLKTVNLPNLTPGVKATFNIGMDVTQALAWLLGLLYRSTSYEEMLTLRGLIKYALGRGMYRRASVDKMKKVDGGVVPLYTREEAVERAKEQSLLSTSTGTYEGDEKIADIMLAA